MSRGLGLTARVLYSLLVNKNDLFFTFVLFIFRSFVNTILVSWFSSLLIQFHEKSENISFRGNFRTVLLLSRAFSVNGVDRQKNPILEFHII